MDSNITYQGYFKNQNINYARYTFDIYPLINNFSFSNYLSQARHYSDAIGDYGAFVIITGKQYIIGYNEGYGEGPHAKTFANVMREIINYQKPILNENDLINLYKMCRKRFITAKIVYHKHTLSDTNYQGYIHFDLTEKDGKQLKNKTITPTLYHSFLQFYNDYQQEIDAIKYHYRNFIVSFTTIKNGYPVLNESSNLEALKNYFDNNVVYNQIDEDQEPERIIGKETSAIIKH